MQPLNYCRQYLSFLQDVVSRKDIVVPELLHYMFEDIVTTMRGAEKFMLPENGRLIDDLSLKALVGQGRLRLPFPMVALEYANTEWEENSKYKPTKTIFLMKEAVQVGPLTWAPPEKGEEPTQIISQTVFYVPEIKAWSTLPHIIIECDNWYKEIVDERVLLQFRCLRDYKKFKDGSERLFEFMKPEEIAFNYAGEVNAATGFLNALACSNVVIESMRHSRVRHAIKGRLPFDSYKMLVLRTSHEHHDGVGGRSGDRHGPREHVRRGHIRKLHSGKCVWINSCVVAAGQGGKIVKDYAFA